MRPPVTQSFFKTRKSKYFSAVTILYRIIHIVLGLDFGFFDCKSKTKIVFCKLITVLQAGLIICVCFYTGYNISPNHYFISGLSFNLTHYLINVMLLVSSRRNRTFRNLHRDLDRIDLKLGVYNVTYNVEKKLTICILLGISLCVCTSVVHCLPGREKLHCYDPIFLLLLTMIFMSFTLVHVTFTFTLFCINCRLRTFKSILRNANCRINQMQSIYKSIVDLTHNYITAFDVLFIATIIFSTIETMGEMVLIVKEIKFQNTISTVVVLMNYAGLLIYLATMFLPALFAEKLASKAKDVKNIVHDKLLSDDDFSRHDELVRFLRYAEARPLRFRVYRVIPLDASLLGMVLNFVVTYLIVILQFMYK